MPYRKYLKLYILLILKTGGVDWNMSLYDEFLKRKERGGSISLDELTSDVLKTMFIEEGKSDNLIAELFDVKPSKITYRRRKNGITIRNSIVDDFINHIPVEVEEGSKEDLLKDENLTKIAKAITHFAFRNGPIEDMHEDTNKNITDEDMQTLNKYMVNRLAYVFMLIIDDRWFELNFLVVTLDKMFGHNWDDAEPDDGRMRELLIKELERYTN